MTTSRADLLVRQLDVTWALFEHHLERLDDAACLWHPAPGCWTVRPDERGRWVADWEVPEPDPAPALSIGWLTWHIGFWWTTTLGCCFGSGAPAREEITWPGSAAGTASWLRDVHQRWRLSLLECSEADLESTELTAALPWGQGQALVHVAGWVNVELTKNVAEIGLVRHLYEASRSARRSAGRPRREGGTSDVAVSGQ